MTLCDCDYDCECDVDGFCKSLEKTGEFYTRFEGAYMRSRNVIVYCRMQPNAEPFRVAIPKDYTGFVIPQLVRDCYAHFGVPLFLTWRGDVGSGRMTLPNFLQADKNARIQNAARWCAT